MSASLGFNWFSKLKINYQKRRGIRERHWTNVSMPYFARTVLEHPDLYDTEKITHVPGYTITHIVKKNSPNFLCTRKNNGVQAENWYYQGPEIFLFRVSYQKIKTSAVLSCTTVVTTISQSAIITYDFYKYITSCSRSTIKIKLLKTLVISKSMFVFSCQVPIKRADIMLKMFITTMIFCLMTWKKTLIFTCIGNC